MSLDHAGIAARIPHRGRMCLLERLESWSAGEIRCSADNHRAPDHPLRQGDRLLAPVAIEYAAQATALHQALQAEAAGASSAAAARPGFIASAREVRLHRHRLDDVAGRLQVHAERQHGDERQSVYRFSVHDDAGRPLVDGRLTVVLDRVLEVAP
jgi:predicted hotdog family 3-hydroxylacyl-ACP dehydratase